MATTQKTPTNQFMCPQCHGWIATYFQLSQDVTIDTGEYDGDDEGHTWPIYETKTATGFVVECPACGAIDGEPPML